MSGGLILLRQTQLEGCYNGDLTELVIYTKKNLKNGLQNALQHFPFSTIKRESACMCFRDCVCVCACVCTSWYHPPPKQFSNQEETAFHPPNLSIFAALFRSSLTTEELWDSEFVFNSKRFFFLFFLNLRNNCSKFTSVPSIPQIRFCFSGVRRALYHVTKPLFCRLKIKRNVIPN